MDTRQIRNVDGYDKFKQRIEKKYGQKIVFGSSDMGIPYVEPENGDQVRAWDTKKLIGNPFGRRGKDNRIPAHFTKTKYTETGYKKKGEDKFTINYNMEISGAGTLAYAEKLGLTKAQIRKAENEGVGNADDIRPALEFFAAREGVSSTIDVLDNGSKVGYVVGTPVAGKPSWRFVPTDETLARGIGGFANVKSLAEVKEIYQYHKENANPKKVAKKERPNLNNTVGLHPSYGSWANFLKDAELREEKKMVSSTTSVATDIISCYRTVR